MSKRWRRNWPMHRGEHGRLTAERSELLAALGTGKVWVCSKCPAVSPADAEYEVGNMEPCVYCEDGTARVVLGKGQDYLSALRGEGWTVAVHNDYRLNGESRTFWLFTKDGRAIKGEGRTDEEALSLCVAASGDLPGVTAALLRASRGAPAPTWGEQAIEEHRRAVAPIVQAPPAGSWQAPRCDKGHVARPGAPCPICRRASLEAALHDPETAEGAAAILADMPPPDPRATLHAGDPESGVDGSGVLVPHPANVLASKRGDK